MTYTVIDIETTGLSRYMHKITEIAAVKINNHNKVVDEWQTLVNPEVKIPSFITHLTGINNEMVKNAPKINKVLPEFHSFLDNDIFVAHNATFDYNFIDYNTEKHLNKNITNHKLCTKMLAGRLFPDIQSKRLSYLSEEFKIKNPQAHRAMADAKTTAELFLKFKEILEEKGIKTNEEILKFQHAKIKKNKPSNN